MLPYRHGRPTLGVLAGYQLYAGTPHSFLEPLFRGIYTAARERKCNLLLACGIGRTVAVNPAWPVLAPENDFVPVGQWNTDGLIIVKPFPAKVHERYVQELLTLQHPLVFVGTGEYSPAVGADNEGGIRQALEHLSQHHQHRRIAFIAGTDHDASDSEPRLRAYRSAVQAYGLDADEGLIARGWHTVQGGYEAIQGLLKSGVNFTAVLASNDESALGALQALREAGRRVPEDVALIGFDDRVEATAQAPLLTTIHYPIFETGQQAVALLLKQLAGSPDKSEVVYVPTHLVIRESCGCAGASTRASLRPATQVESAQRRAPDCPSLQTELVQALSEAVFAEVQQLNPAEVDTYSRQLVEAFVQSLREGDAAPFYSAWLEIMQQVEDAEDDPHAWQMAVVILQRRLPALLEVCAPAASRSQAEEMFIQALMLIGKSMQRRHSRYVVHQGDLANQVGLVTAQLLTALDETQILSILAKRSPQIGIRSLHVLFFNAKEDDPLADSVLPILTGRETPTLTRYVFPTHQFPPAGLYPADEPFQVALLPLVLQEERHGYVAFDAANLMPCAAIVRQLAAALQGARLYQETVQGRQLAEEANRLKSSFLSTVSHELRTPINLIVSLSELLLREPAPMVRDDLERLHDSAQHLGWLIRDVLDLASSEAGQLRLVGETLNPSDVLRLAAATGKQLTRDKGLEWVEVIPDDLPPVWADRTRLQQVVLNLVSNAVKFTAHGRITLTVERMGKEEGRRKKEEGIRDTSFLLPSSSLLCISVSDTGLGIPLSEQEFIFDEFRQSERTTARGYGGLGLGLAICKRLVELHRGQIGVYSSGEEGAGSTFYFTLPIQEDSGSPPVAPLTSQTVLVLTEQPGGGNYLCEYLRREGFEVEERLVGAATDWLPALLAFPPGAVVLDPGLASTRGWETLKVLKSNPATRDVPILFYSLTPEQNASFMLELDYLTKPVGASELAEALARQGLQAGENSETKTVLIVDDEPDILEMHARMVQLQPGPYRILKAHNGSEALAILQQAHPDLMLLDLMMPEVDGFGVLEAMRERETTRDIPVVVLTAQVLTEADMTRLNRGVATVLKKGLFSVPETLAHIESALARNQRLGAKAQRLVRKAMAYLHAHFAEPQTRETVADYVGVSPGHLDLCFRQEMGLTPMTYLNRYRVNRAKDLLTAGELSLTEIALEVGFADSAHFSHVFRREVGLSPGAYRRGRRAD